MLNFDRTNKSILGNWWWTVDRYTLSAVGLLTAIGIILVMAASPVIAQKLGLSPMHFVIRQLIFLFAGAICIISFSLMNPVVIRRVALLGFVGSIIFLLLVHFIGADIKGAKRWIFVAGFSLQPSEFVKPFFAVVTAWILAQKNMIEGYPGYRISLILYMLVISLLIIQPDFGMTLSVSAVWFCQLFISGIPIIWIVGVAILGIGGLISGYMLLPHVKNRIDLFFDPSTGDNFQVVKSREAFTNGGFFGQGPGEGLVKNIIPDSHTDFIFAVAGEELGTIICLFIVLLFCFIIVRGFYKISKENNLFVVYATAGLLIQFGIQAIVNMGVTLGLLPNTGMTLPFISYGGSSTLAISISIGMILSFTRRRYGENI